MSGFADGVIVGSAVVKQIAAHQNDRGMVSGVSDFVRALKAAMAQRRV
jgi:tryptophan synthase alpha chain